MSAIALAPLAVGVAVAALAVALAWGRVALQRVTYRHQMNPDRIFPGESAELIAELSNAKGVGVPWILSRDDLPAGLAVTGGRLEPHHLPGRAQLVQIWSLGPRERVRRRFRVRAGHRGLHQIGPASLRAGDPFGWRDRVEDPVLGAGTRLLVYPHAYPLAAWRILAERPFGQQPRSGWLFTDPAQVVGARPYRPGDPYRLVHWPATARLGTIQVKQTVPARSVAAAIFLDVRTAEHAWEGVDRARAEAAIALAATLAREAVTAHGEVALYANTPVRDTASIVRVPFAAGAAQLRRVLEALALAGVHPWARIENLMALDARALPPGVRILVITPLCTAEVVTALAALCRGGRPIDLFRVGSGHPAPAPEQPGLRSYLVEDAQVTAWWNEHNDG